MLGVGVAPLGEQLDTTEFAAPTGRVKERSRRDEDEDYVESRLSKNIITQARIQVNIDQKHTFNLATLLMMAACILIQLLLTSPISSMCCHG